ncbi:MAG: DUF1007 family protein [Smithella sp.]|nr:DUF1007 family protein [Smithella sp.]
MDLLIAVGLLMAVVQMSHAHPHVFIDVRVDVQFSADGLSGIQVEWVFDAMFGSSLIADYDRNKNGRFDAGEIAHIEKEAFSNLVNFNYFTYIIDGGKRRDISQVSDFKASIFGKTVKYAFFIPLEYSYDKIDGDRFIGFFDKTNYCDFQFNAARPFSVSAPPGIDIVAKIVNTKDGWVRNRAFEELRIQYKKR